MGCQGGASEKCFKSKLKRPLQQNSVAQGSMLGFSNLFVPEPRLQQFGDSRGLADPRKLSEVGSLVAEHFFKRILLRATVLFEQIKARGSGIHLCDPI